MPIVVSRQTKVSPSSRQVADSTAGTPKAQGRAPAARVDAFESSADDVVIGRGEPQIDLNGTPYTSVEGGASDNRISIHLLPSRKDFDPLKDPGVALTTSQARALGVSVGDKVIVHDRVTGKNVVADFYDGAGRKPDGLKHFEIDPALADQLGISYRNRKGRVIDALVGSENMVGRFEIRRHE